MSAAEWMRTNRIGQITGSTRRENPKWPLTVDSMGWPLLNDTGRWGILGTDLGANTEHNGRLYIFTGDVAIEAQQGFPGFGGDPNVLNNADAVLWTENKTVLRNGGHLALGFSFVLPNDQQGALDSTGQRDWRMCGKCGSLFFSPNGNTAGTRCFVEGEHRPVGWNFFLPSIEQGASDASGQKGWRFCGKCHGLFFSPDGLQAGVCPNRIGDLPSKHDAIGRNFVLPNREGGASDTSGQPGWRFCGNCKGLFWGGDAFKGLCRGSQGGGVHLQAALRPPGDLHPGVFAPFQAGEPIGITNSLEVPSGAFSYEGRAYVFLNTAEPNLAGRARFGDPTVGTYLVSKADPSQPGLYQKEFLVSPRIGCCPRLAESDLRESHEVLGSRFVLPHAGGVSTGSNVWRRCRKCSMLFFDTGAALPCWKGGAHAPDGLSYVLQPGVQGDDQHQGAWCRCIDCNSLFWNGDSQKKGICQVHGDHRPSTETFLLPHLSFPETGQSQKNWRFCSKCAALFFWNGDPQAPNICPRDGARHEARGVDFVLPHDIPADAQHQPDWRFCLKCHGMFWDGDSSFKGVCPRDGRAHAHENVGYKFVLRHDIAGDTFNQSDWRFCVKCASLYWSGGDGGICKADGRAHDHGRGGFNFVLAHNPGEDKFNEGRWRFCRKCHGMVWAGQIEYFSGAAAWRVENAKHDLPETNGLGVVLCTKSFWEGFAPNPGFRLAWMPLRSPEPPKFQDIRYYTGVPGVWSQNPEDAKTIVPRSEHYTSVSIAWLDGPKCWILLYSNAHDELGFNERKGPVMARFSTQLWDWTEPVVIFDPVREDAYGKGGFAKYMHWPGEDRINLDIPPLPVPTPEPTDDPNLREDKPGWAYGAFILNRYTEWDEASRTLGIYYLMSTSRPYQIHIMHTQVRMQTLGVEIPEWISMEEVLNGDDMAIVRPSAEQLGLSLRLKRDRTNADVPHGEIVLVSPPRGTIVPPGGNITVRVKVVEGEQLPENWPQIEEG